MYTLVDSDTDSDGADLDSILASASLPKRHDSSTTAIRQHGASIVRAERLTFSETATTAEMSRRTLTVSTSRSILSVLEENNWDEQTLPTTSAAESPEPRKKRRRTATTSDAGRAASEAKDRERAQAKAERERRKLQEKNDRQRARDEAKVTHALARTSLTRQAAREAERSYQKKLKEVNRVSGT